MAASPPRVRDAALPAAHPATHLSIGSMPAPLPSSGFGTFSVVAPDPNNNVTAAYNGKANLTASNADNSSISVLPTSLTLTGARRHCRTERGVMF
jgi:hypothetical protein